MSQTGKGETSTLNILFLGGAIGIGIWFLTVASDFADSGTICGVFLVVVVLAEVMKSLSGSTKNNTELGGENTSSDTSEGERKNDISLKQIFVILFFVAVILFVFMYSLASST